MSCIDAGYQTMPIIPVSGLSTLMLSPKQWRFYLTKTQYLWSPQRIETRFYLSQLRTPLKTRRHKSESGRMARLLSKRQRRKLNARRRQPSVIINTQKRRRRRNLNAQRRKGLLLLMQRLREWLGMVIPTPRLHRKWAMA